MISITTELSVHLQTFGHAQLIEMPDSCFMKLTRFKEQMYGRGINLSLGVKVPGSLEIDPGHNQNSSHLCKWLCLPA